ncbi:MAG: 4Fe-4S dicluster domain-containing protein, partial [Desulfatirhabdiaceae bacterium]
PVLFEPYAFESLKAAHDMIFSEPVLPSFHMDQADLLVGFGADFLETWLSPVEYARKFKAMHALHDGRKGIFIAITPFQSLTAANADHWMACRSGGEAAVVFGLIREMIDRGRGTELPDPVRRQIIRICDPFTSSEASRLSGIPVDAFDMLSNRLMDAKSPLVLGSGPGMDSRTAMQTDIGVSLLNLILDPGLTRYDFQNRHRIECAAKRSDVSTFFETIDKEPVELLLLHNTNPVFTLPSAHRLSEIISRETLFVVSFTNFMDETAEQSDLIYPIQLPLETWDAYEGKTHVTGTLQPAMAGLTQAPGVGDMLLRCAFGDKQPVPNYKSYVARQLNIQNHVQSPRDWVTTIQAGGILNKKEDSPLFPGLPVGELSLEQVVHDIRADWSDAGLIFMAVPSLRFYDGRGANKPWLNEAPEPLTLVCWQSVVQAHPHTMAAKGWKQGDMIQFQSNFGIIQAPVFDWPGIHPGTVAMTLGQGHTAYGRYAKNQGQNPLTLLDHDEDPITGGPSYLVRLSEVYAVGQKQELAHLDGSRSQHGRNIALTCDLEIVRQPQAHSGQGLGMRDFPLTLPIPEGYDEKRDIYPSHPHTDYRWGMVVDLDRCIGCGACTVACYAENNIGMVGERQILAGREMAWLRIERYLDPDDMRKIIFLPMMCQHCDNAPCESVCPVYAPHHSKEGINNQIYNRCIGTRFCAQNCPYKVRRFNWLNWDLPEPLPLQLNPDVTVRSAGVMEKCSFCIQRIKDGHDMAKNEKRLIRDGEIIPACVQTCPTQALVFGNFMDPGSRVRMLADDPRAYQVLGYLNTKPAVIYLKKVMHEGVSINTVEVTPHG